MDKKLITVFTPTYNRIKLLAECHESLKRQSVTDFLWLVVDDGSEDGTEELVRKWMGEDNGFEIRYIRKPNGGLHTAYNAAVEVMDTELAICVDSDDYLTDDAIESITNWWRKHGGSDYAGIVALNRTQEKEVLGQKLPNLDSAYLIDLYCRYGCRSDLKMIYRTELLKSEGPIPVFGNEKHMNPYYLFLKIDKKLPMVVMNKAVCVVNYQNDGMSSDIFRQYVASARSFAELRCMMVSMERATMGYILKNSIHLVSSALLAGDLSLLGQAPRKWITALAFLPGVALCALTRVIYLRKYKR